MCASIWEMMTRVCASIWEMMTIDESECKHMEMMMNENTSIWELMTTNFESVCKHAHA